jgi:CubicO group peptidase (beta-lactamase class C family)
MTREYELPRQPPERQGIPSSAIDSFIDAVQKHVDELHSFMLLRHGAIVAEGWWSPYRADRRHMLFSLSKSFTSTAIGLAVAEKRLSIDDSVLSFFPNDAPVHVSKNLAAMRVRHLLSMSTGHAKDTMPALHKRRDKNWVKAFFACPVMYQPGTHFLYNTGATYILSAIVQKISGMTLLDYLKPRLLDPLEIENSTWEMSPQGICTGGYGMNVTTEDIARFGQLYLQKGDWHGKLLIPEAWVTEATSRQIANDNEKNADWQQGYGYQFWRCQHGAYRGDGAFGQYCIVMPEQDAVLAITSAVADMQPVLNLVWEHLLPAMAKTDPLRENPEAQTKLKQKLGSLAYLAPQGKTSSPIAADVSGKTYTLEPNDLKFKTISFDFSEAMNRTVTIHNAKGKHVIVCGAGVWREGKSTLFGTYPSVAASGTWAANDMFVITLRFYETPFVYTLACHFTGDQLTVDYSVNVGFVLTPHTLSGKLRK